MNLRTLIERLEEIEGELRDGPEPVVVAAYQEHYPLAGTILGAAVVEAVRMHDRPVVWIAVGGLPMGIGPYAPRAVFEEAS